MTDYSASSVNESRSDSNEQPLHETTDPMVLRELLRQAHEQLDLHASFDLKLADNIRRSQQLLAEARQNRQESLSRIACLEILSSVDALRLQLAQSLASLDEIQRIIVPVVSGNGAGSVQAPAQPLAEAPARAADQPPTPAPPTAQVDEQPPAAQVADQTPPDAVHATELDIAGPRSEAAPEPTSGDAAQLSTQPAPEPTESGTSAIPAPVRTDVVIQNITSPSLARSAQFHLTRQPGVIRADVRELAEGVLRITVESSEALTASVLVGWEPNRSLEVRTDRPGVLELELSEPSS